jgi:segregation and condensation protein B
MTAAPSDPSPLELGQAAAARFGGVDWSVDVDETLAAEAEAVPATAVAQVPEAKVETRPQVLFPSSVQTPTETPPSPLQIVEAMLFVGGPPLTAEKVCSAVRGLTPERVRELIDELGRKYRRQNRPYTVQQQGDGFALMVKPQYRALRERLYGGPKEARLSQPALDVLSLIAYRQPIPTAEVESLRGADSIGVIRQLVRLGLIAVVERGGEAGTKYGTAPRFLELFGLSSLEDLPKLGE